MEIMNKDLNMKHKDSASRPGIVSFTLKIKGQIKRMEVSLIQARQKSI